MIIVHLQDLLISHLTNIQGLFEGAFIVLPYAIKDVAKTSIKCFA